MDEHTIRERAYDLWEKEGSPEGRDAEFWERARLLIEAEAAGPIATPLQEGGDRAHDKALEESFPASDPPARTQVGKV